jgi:3-isopropylmalate dehydratase small subunit
MMANDLIIEGRLWVLRDAQGVAIDDIDTDMIFHNAHLAITELAEMGQHALGNLEGYEDFQAKAEPGDIILTGRNFGSGSSRQQAVDCFVSLGVTLLMAESFGAIYKRNAINAGFPIMEASGLSVLTDGDKPWISSGDRVRVELETGLVTRLADGATHPARPMSGVQRDIYKAGDLFAYGRTL